MLPERIELDSDMTRAAWQTAWPPAPGVLLREAPPGRQQEAAHYKERLAELHSASLWVFDFFYLKIVCLSAAFPQILPSCERNLIYRTFYISNAIY